MEVYKFYHKILIQSQKHKFNELPFELINFILMYDQNYEDNIYFESSSYKEQNLFRIFPIIMRSNKTYYNFLMLERKNYIRRNSVVQCFEMPTDQDKKYKIVLLFNEIIHRNSTYIDSKGIRRLRPAIFVIMQQNKNDKIIIGERFIKNNHILLSEKTVVAGLKHNNCKNKRGKYQPAIIEYHHSMNNKCKHYYNYGERLYIKQTKINKKIEFTIRCANYDFYGDIVNTNKSETDKVQVNQKCKNNYNTKMKLSSIFNINRYPKTLNFIKSHVTITYQFIVGIGVMTVFTLTGLGIYELFKEKL